MVKQIKLLKNHSYFLEPVDCQWSEWIIPTCSATCGKGYREKIRTKIVKEKDGGVCSGKDVENEYCNQKECLGITDLQNIDRFLLCLY